MVTLGVDYYPEHWDKSLWREDAERMKKAGVSIIRVGEFAWSMLEPEEGRFEFDWLDEAVRIFSGAGIDIIIGTPTNCPPRWLYEKYPEAVWTDRSGKKIALGIRGHRCYSSPVVREKSEIIIRKLCERYKDEPHVVGWQTDNELEASQCCCELCNERFRKHLKEKYGTIDKLNDLWGMNVWSGSYSSFEQIDPPYGSYNIGWYNPSYMLEWERFGKELASDFSNYQARLIRSICKDTVITTNTWFCEYPPDFYDLFRELDVVSYDNYPVSRLPDDPDALYTHAFHLDLMRGIKNKNFWIMEQLAGPAGCWAPPSAAPRKGMIMGYGMQAVAHGADKVLFFRWRSASKGAEMFWFGLLDHSSRDTRRLGEFTQLADELRELQIPEDSVIRNDTALLYSPDCDTALYLQKQSYGLHYYDQLKGLHDGITSLGKGCDIISPEADLSAYKTVIAPALFMCSDKAKQSLRDFVKGGGTLLITPRSFIKNTENTCPMEPIPCGMNDVSGCVVDDFEPLGYNRVRVTMDGKEYDAGKWSESLEMTEGAEVSALGEFTSGQLTGETFLTCNKYGKGQCWYVGIIGKRDFYKALMRKIFDSNGTAYVPDLPLNVEITVRESKDSTFTFIFNNNEHSSAFVYNGQAIELAPFECRVITDNK